MSEPAPEPADGTEPDETAQSQGQPESGSGSHESDPAQQMQEQLEVRVRRSPKYAPFVMAGVVAGFIVAGILATLPVDMSKISGEFSRGQGMGIMMAVLGVVGGFLGAIVVLVLDRRSVKRASASTVTAQYESEVIPPSREELVEQAKQDLAADKAAKKAAKKSAKKAEGASSHSQAQTSHSSADPIDAEQEGTR